ncbi:dynactin p62 family-domain-containing protein, partial [Lipomyces oligophaga]|uniref:dynactin p62 family-domain-containing protein n=1 Tax=Lipomyces oligophaga TaxID=45792 RepID=UPI0034CE07F2
MASQYPIIRIHCPCAESISEEDDSKSADQDSPSKSNVESLQSSPFSSGLLLPPTISSPFALHTLNSLYFCDACMALRCERCVVEEVVQIFCPACLHVYASESTSGIERISRRGGGEDFTFCTRNCLRCPLCLTGLVMFSTDEPKFSDFPIYMQCPHCKWDSRNSTADIRFNKQASLYQQLRAKIRTESGVENDQEVSIDSSETLSFASLLELYKEQYAATADEDLESNKLAATTSSLFPDKRISRSLETSRFLKTSHLARQREVQGGSPTRGLDSPSINPASVISIFGRSGGISSRKTRQQAEAVCDRLTVKLD